MKHKLPIESEPARCGVDKPPVSGIITHTGSDGGK